LKKTKALMPASYGDRAFSKKVKSLKMVIRVFALFLIALSFLSVFPISAQYSTSVRLGISTDYWSLSPLETKNRMEELGIAFFSQTVDCRFDYIGRYISRLKQLAELLDGTNMVIHVLFNPLYGFHEEARSEQWWIDVVTYTMDQLKDYSSVKYVGLYCLEHYAGQLLDPPQYSNPDAIAALTQTQVETAYARFNSLAAEKGFTVLHWGLNLYGKSVSWNTEAWFEGICSGKDHRFCWGGYPDPYAGWIYTEYPGSEWQYQWVEDYEVTSKYPKSPFALFTGMWSSECSHGTADEKGWTYRNTKWYLDAIKAKAPDLQYAVFSAWVDVLLTENTEWQRAVLEFTGGEPPPPPPTFLATITGKVTDEQMGEPISDAQVDLDGYQNTTDANGVYAFTVPLGLYNMTISKVGYETKVILNINTTIEGTYTVNVALSPVSTPFATIKGTVIDEQIGNPIANAQVACNGYQNTTAQNGVFTLNLPIGSYNITISKEGYFNQSFILDCPTEGTYQIGTITLWSIPPPPGKGTLRVHAYSNKSEITANVKVAAVGNFTTPFTMNLDPGSYTLNSTYTNQTQTRTVEISEGQTTLAEFNFEAPSVTEPEPEPQPEPQPQPEPTPEPEPQNEPEPTPSPNPNPQTVIARVPEFTSILIAISLGVGGYLLGRRSYRRRDKT